MKPKKMRKRVRRSPTVTQAQVSKRMRETVGTGFSYDMGHAPEDYRMVRNGMRELAADDDFWDACEYAAKLRQEARRIVDSVKNPPRQGRSAAKSRKRAQLEKGTSRASGKRTSK